MQIKNLKARKSVQKFGTIIWYQNPEQLQIILSDLFFNLIIGTGQVQSGIIKAPI